MRGVLEFHWVLDILITVFVLLAVVSLAFMAYTSTFRPAFYNTITTSIVEVSAFEATFLLHDLVMTIHIDQRLP